MADPALEPINVVIEGDDDGARMIDGNLEIPTEDGGVVIQFNPQAEDDEDIDNPSDFYKNIAGKLDEGRLNQIAQELIDGINADDQSRSGALANRVKNMSLLGLESEEPRDGDGAQALGGMSVVTNPLLLEAILKDWANAQAEFLPSGGPCKVEDVGDDPEVAMDALADAYERDMNYFLTSIHTEYAPETSHMLLWGRAFGGSGFKKVYMDPMKKRPTTESVDMQNLIVSDATKDLKACKRITHVIPMAQSDMKKMQRKGFYLDVALTPPAGGTGNAVDQKIATTQGVAAASRPEDQPYTLYETQCELELDEFAPKDMRGLSLPYLVTIEKDTQKILALRRDWKPEDEDCARKRMYVKYPYIPGPGFFGTGLSHILGNSSAAMTAAWRLALDGAFMANFPAFLLAKLGGRQNSSDLTLNPGTGTLIETNGQPINEIVANLPFKEAGPGMMALMDKITEQSKEVGASANIPVGEGVKDVPVGTMLAHIETATKLMAATHKLAHEAQAEEIGLIADLFKEMPESFWKGNKTKFARKFGWTEEKLLQAINTVNLVPKSDPNIPSHIHRIMRAAALVELQSGPLGALMDPMEVLKRVLRAMREDEKGLVKQPPPAQTGPTPEEKAADAKMLDAQTKSKKVDTDAAIAQQKGQLDAAQQKSDIQKDTIDMAKELVIHKADMAKVAADQNKGKAELGLKANQQAHDQTMDKAKHGLDTGVAAHQANLDTHQAILDTAEAMKPEPEPAAGASPAKPKKPKATT